MLITTVAAGMNLSSAYWRQIGQIYSSQGSLTRNYSSCMGKSSMNKQEIHTAAAHRWTRNPTSLQHTDEQEIPHHSHTQMNKKSFCWDEATWVQILQSIPTPKIPLPDATTWLCILTKYIEDFFYTGNIIIITLREILREWWCPPPIATTESLSLVVRFQLILHLMYTTFSSDGQETGRK